jgi:hypothetical protein
MTNSENNSGNKLSLICPFIDQSESYAYGFEAGRLFESMANEVPIVEGVYHYDNVGQLMLLATHLGYRPTPLSKLEGWVEMRFEKLPPEESTSE